MYLDRLLSSGCSQFTPSKLCKSASSLCNHSLAIIKIYKHLWISRGSSKATRRGRMGFTSHVVDSTSLLYFIGFLRGICSSRCNYLVTDRRHYPLVFRGRSGRRWREVRVPGAHQAILVIGRPMRQSCVSARRSHADVAAKFKSKYKLLLAGLRRCLPLKYLCFYADRERCTLHVPGLSRTSPGLARSPQLYADVNETVSIAIIMGRDAGSRSHVPKEFGRS